VRYDRSRTGAAEIQEAVRALGYAPVIVERGAGERVELLRVEVGLLPGGLQQLLARSRETRKPVLLDFFAPD
jgi:hypothetical protein